MLNPDTLACYATRETDTSGKPYVRIYLTNLTDDLQSAFQRKSLRAYLLPHLYTQLCQPAWKTYEIFFPQLNYANNTLIDLKPMSSVTFGPKPASLSSQDQIANTSPEDPNGGGRRLFHVS